MAVYWSLLVATVIGAVGLWLIMAAASRPLRLLGVILAVGSLALALARIAVMADGGGDGVGDRPPVLFYLFALIAAGCAVRMITHSRPVYSALYFVLVVLSSAAIFLYLEAEFMAFALVIVYAGAILITYLFVLMLAQQAPTAENESIAPEYDRIPREPAAAVFAGFLLLALLGQLIVNSGEVLPAQPTVAMQREARIERLNLLEGQREEVVRSFQEADPGLPIDSRIAGVDAEGVTFIVPPADRAEMISYADAGVSEQQIERMLPGNIENVGLALVHTFPVSLELAGVILLMAMFGAVVLARKQIELSEDEKRAAAGMARLSVEPAESHASGGEGA